MFVPNEDELIRLTGAGSFEAAVAAATAWGTPLVVKRGAAGAVVAGPDGMTEIREGVQQGQGPGPDRGGRRLRRGD